MTFEMEDSEEHTSYDEVPYESQSFPQSHPNRLATLGRLFGLSPAPVAQCRVLELGCASGGNLIPMAYHLPESEFVGLDLIRQSSDSYLFHDHMEEVNAPVYFYQFVDRADRHGLQYLGEANFSSMLTSGFPKEDDKAYTSLPTDARMFSITGAAVKECPGYSILGFRAMTRFFYHGVLNKSKIKSGPHLKAGWKEQGEVVLSQGLTPFSLFHPP